MLKTISKIKIFLLITLLLAPFSLIASDESFIDQLMPNSFFYFIKTFKERISLILILNPQKRAEKALEYSKEKLQEAEKMSNLNNPKALKKALSLYQFYVSMINNISITKNINIDGIKEKLAQYSNNESVKSLYEQLPPPNQDTFKEFLERGTNAFKKIFIFLIELVFKIKEFLQNLVKQFSSL